MTKQCCNRILAQLPQPVRDSLPSFARVVTLSAGTAWRIPQSVLRLLAEQYSELRRLLVTHTDLTMLKHRHFHIGLANPTNLDMLGV